DVVAIILESKPDQRVRPRRGDDTGFDRVPLEDVRVAIYDLGEDNDSVLVDVHPRSNERRSEIIAKLTGFRGQQETPIHVNDIGIINRSITYIRRLTGRCDLVFIINLAAISINKISPGIHITVKTDVALLRKHRAAP